MKCQRLMRPVLATVALCLPDKGSTVLRNATVISAAPHITHHHHQSMTDIYNMLVKNVKGSVLNGSSISK